MAQFTVLLIAQVIVLASGTTLYDSKPSDIPTVRHPVILVPGIEASRLESKLDKKSSKYWFCPKKQDWNTVWIRVENLFPVQYKCFEEDFKLRYNATSRHSYNLDGVEIRPYKFGDTEGIQFPDSDSAIPIYNAMVVALTKMNYTINKDLRGAPYDFRKSPDDNTEFAIDFKHLIEETYGNNSNTPVYLVSHSMGCLYTLYFLDAQPQAWKDKHIKAFIPVSGPWGGSGAALAAIALGDNFDIAIMIRRRNRDLDRTLTSTFGLLPSVVAFPNQTLVSYNGRTYNVKDYDAIFELYNISNGKLIYGDSKDLTITLPHPKVDVFCIHGNGHDTIEGLVYDSKAQFPNFPNIMNGPGDGLVNLGSLEACQRWASETKFRFNYTVFDGVEHASSIWNTNVIQLVTEILQQ